MSEETKETVEKTEETSILEGAKSSPEKSDGKPETKPEAKADGGSKPATDAAKPADEKPTEDKKPADAKPIGAPEKYEPFKVPEGVQFSESNQAAFSGLAKELGLTQEAAQKLVDYQANAVKQSLESQKSDFVKMQTEWKEETKKELGATADKQLAYAAQARDKFASQGLRQILEDSGLANHPEVVKLFITLGKSISEDGFVDGKPANADAGRSAADVIYPNQGKDTK
jgi:hypothetical protein